MSRFALDAVGKVRRSSHPQPSAYCLCLRKASSNLLSLHRYQAPKSSTVSVRVRSTLLPQQLVPVEGPPPVGARARTRGRDLVSCWQSSSEKKPGAHRTVRKTHVRKRYAGLRHLRLDWRQAIISQVLVTYCGVCARPRQAACAVQCHMAAGGCWEVRTAAATNAASRTTLSTIKTSLTDCSPCVEYRARASSNTLLYPPRTSATLTKQSFTRSAVVYRPLASRLSTVPTLSQALNRPVANTAMTETIAAADIDSR